jgi:hypothetical protein
MRFPHFTFASVVTLLFVSQPVQSASTTAAEWYSDCAAYIGVLTGTGDGDDLEITYCMGQTLGIVSGLETGSRIGALSMASLLALLLNLDRDSVFQIFNEVSPEELLGFCKPTNATGSQLISIVADYLRRHPDKAELPATAVFFEALQEAYPCASDPQNAGPQEPADAEQN